MSRQKRDEDNISQIEQMSEKELEALISFLFAADDPDSIELQIAASRELQRRKEAAGVVFDSDAAWETFKQDYLPYADLGDEEGDRRTNNRFSTAKVAAGTEHSEAKRIASKVFQGVAAAVLIIVILGMTACAVIPEVRASVVRFVVRTFGTHSVISMDADSETGSEDETVNFSNTGTFELNGYSFCVPVDYELDSVTQNNGYSYNTFVSDDSSIVVFVCTSKYSPVQIDTEATDARRIQINGNEGVVIKKDAKIYITWGEYSADKVIYIFGENVEEELLISIANTFISCE